MFTRLRGPLATALGCAVVLVLVAGCGGGASSPTAARPATPAPPSAEQLATTFLRDYLDPDGRIVRRDQGGDTVSEGQAYGMQLAIVASDRPRFDRIWQWTQDHLLQSNGLLAWRWSNGAVADEQSAADADVDTATALLLAGEDFAQPSYTDAGRTLAAAILRGETVATPAGPLLAAGPWAVANPAVLNPSYLVGGTAEFLAARTGDATWTAVATATRQLDARLASGRTLPPDWATLPAGAAPNQATAAAAPNAAGGPTYGLDAPRLLIRLAASCSAQDRQLAAQSSILLGRTGQPAIRALDGAAQVSWTHPVSDVAVAAVAAVSSSTASDNTAANNTAAHNTAAGASPAGGQSEQVALAAASAQQTTTPTYYGAAWVALGSAYLTHAKLNRC